MVRIAIRLTPRQCARSPRRDGENRVQRSPPASRLPTPSPNARTEPKWRPQAHWGLGRNTGLLPRKFHKSSGPRWVTGQCRSAWGVLSHGRLCLGAEDRRRWIALGLGYAADQADEWEYRMCERAVFETDTPTLTPHIGIKCHSRRPVSRSTHEPSVMDGVPRFMRSTGPTVGAQRLGGGLDWEKGRLPSVC